MLKSGIIDCLQSIKICKYILPLMVLWIGWNPFLLDSTLAQNFLRQIITLIHLIDQHNKSEQQTECWCSHTDTHHLQLHTTFYSPNYTLQCWCKCREESTQNRTAHNINSPRNVILNSVYHIEFGSVWCLAGSYANNSDAAHFCAVFWDVCSSLC